MRKQRRRAGFHRCSLSRFSIGVELAPASAAEEFLRDRTSGAEALAAKWAEVREVGDSITSAVPAFLNEIFLHQKFGGKTSTSARPSTLTMSSSPLTNDSPTSSESSSESKRTGT